MNESHDTHHASEAHHRPAHQGAQHPGPVAHEREATKPSGMPVVHDELTVYTEDGKWKAVMRAWKDYWLFYNSIGAKVDVYERRQTSDIWGHKTTDWVKTPAEIFMIAHYQGDVSKSPAGGPPSGGLGNFDQSKSFRDAHGELRLWAAGFFTTSISVAGEETVPAGATLDIHSVVAEIEVSTPSGPIHGTVGASSYLSDNSAWG
jgi:hypothetical protein